MILGCPPRSNEVQLFAYSPPSHYLQLLHLAQLKFFNKNSRTRDATQVVTNLGLKYSKSENSCRFHLQASVSLPSELIHGMLQKQSLLY
jgi:hypothetical protein